ncbi:MAG: cation-translocating P-type ATPase [Neisseriales bacterium]|nr:MAG: cation-translocating P-type ATPase [Neisseriales bacterium]
MKPTKWIGKTLVNKTIYRVVGMECPMEEMLIRDKLRRLSGIENLVFDLAKSELTVYHRLANTDVLVKEIAALGLRAEMPSQSNKWKWHSGWLRLIVAGILALSAEILEWTPTSIPWLGASLSIIALLMGGLTTYQRGWIALLHGNISINALVSVAATGAFLIQEWSEAAMTVILYVVAEQIETRSVVRTRHTIHSLMALAPKQAEVMQPSGCWQLIAVSDIKIKNKIRLKAGECVPLDGVIDTGFSTVNLASISGESAPVGVKPGDKLFAGSINQENELEYTVTADERHSTLARMVNSAESWQVNRAPTERWIERFACIYTPVIFCFAALLAIVPPIFDHKWLDWLYRSLVLLVTACPCALVIAIPATIVSGLTLAMRKGILIKGGVFLEQGRLLDYLVFDKTGTLTLGKPVVNEFVCVQSDKTVILNIASSLAKRSVHPFSRAVVAYQQQYKELPIELKIHSVSAKPGCGVAGHFDKKCYYLGSERWIRSLHISTQRLDDKLNAFNKAGESTVLLADNNTILAIFSITDPICPTSKSVVNGLRNMGLKTLMLSGDNAAISKNIASQVGVTQFKSDLLPAQKAEVIADLIRQHHHVGMVGDGVNDVPALACANVGFAMAKEGADATIGAADVVFMDNDLRKIPTFILLSRYTMFVLKQNIALALGAKLLFIIATIFGYSAMWMAVIADMGTNLLVAANGLKILRKTLPCDRH